MRASRSCSSQDLFKLATRDLEVLKRLCRSCSCCIRFCVASRTRFCVLSASVKRPPGEAPGCPKHKYGDIKRVQYMP